MYAEHAKDLRCKFVFASFSMGFRSAEGRVWLETLVFLTLVG